MLQVYCGDGKGKTTAALGLAVRAAGGGMRVMIMQFLKGGETSELRALSCIPNITVRRCDKEYCFVHQMTETDRQQITACHNALLREAAELMAHGGVELLILDEIFAAYACGLLDKSLADSILLRRPLPLELVLTGRNPPDSVLQGADYISEIHAIKHPFENGVPARRGIEY